MKTANEIAMKYVESPSSELSKFSSYTSSSSTVKLSYSIWIVDDSMLSKTTYSSVDRLSTIISTCSSYSAVELSSFSSALSFFASVLSWLASVTFSFSSMVSSVSFTTSAFYSSSEVRLLSVSVSKSSSTVLSSSTGFKFSSTVSLASLSSTIPSVLAFSIAFAAQSGQKIIAPSYVTPGVSLYVP